MKMKILIVKQIVKLKLFNIKKLRKIIKIFKKKKKI